MRALVTGAGGQLGRALLASAPPGIKTAGFTSTDLDITDASAVTRAVGAFAPDIVFNAAAYTEVDRAEAEPSRAAEVNDLAVGHLASAARATGALLVHVSTDFVFDGASGKPYRPSDEPDPQNVYGSTKLAGERRAGDGSLIVRTSWVYSVQGRNFLLTMLRLMREKEEIRVVSDQIGAPTYAPGLADTLWALAEARATGIFHYSDSGVASWYDFAVAIREEGVRGGLLDPSRSAQIQPIPSSAYPTAARRPHYSVLDNGATRDALGKTAPHWRANLRLALLELKAAHE